MGLTVGCARCHDHKFDAIYQKDYYGMASVFASSRFKDYAQVPKAVYDEWEKENKVLEKKNEASSKFLDRRLRPLRPDALLADRDLHAGGLQGRDRARRRRSRALPTTAKLDPEVLGRWVRFLKKKPDNYPHLKGVAGDDRREGQGRRGQEAREGVHDKVAEINEKRDQAGEGERSHAGAGAVARTPKTSSIRCRTARSAS